MVSWLGWIGVVSSGSGSGVVGRSMMMAVIMVRAVMMGRVLLLRCFIFGMISGF